MGDLGQLLNKIERKKERKSNFRKVGQLVAYSAMAFFALYKINSPYNIKPEGLLWKDTIKPIVISKPPVYKIDGTRIDSNYDTSSTYKMVSDSARTTTRSTAGKY